MKSSATFLAATAFGLVILSGCSPREAGETASASVTPATDPFHQARATPEAASLARRVIDAHGGIDAWRAAKTLRYTQSLFIPGERSPWVATETVEQTPVRRLYQDWSSPGGSLVWDGGEVWTVNWQLENPPKLMPFLTYYSLITPWLALDEHVTIEASGQDEIPGLGGTRFDTVAIKVQADSTRPPVAGYYRVFLDPASGRMRAMSYSVTYGPLLDAMGLPGDVNEMGPITHVYDEYTTVGGLLLPVRYHTVGADGSRYGDHEVVGWEVGAKFDETRMVKPSSAVVDASSFGRKGAAPRP